MPDTAIAKSLFQYGRYLTCNQNNMTNRGGTDRAKNEFKIKAHFRKVYSL